MARTITASSRPKLFTMRVLVQTLVRTSIVASAMNVDWVARNSVAPCFCELDPGDGILLADDMISEYSANNCIYNLLRICFQR